MKIYNLKTKQYETHAEFAAKVKRTAIALGNFDGVHIGHGRLLKAAFDETAEAAHEAKDGAASVVWTFAEPPKSHLSPSESVNSITSADEKLRLFAEYGLDYAVFEDFAAVRHLTPDEFVKSVLISKLGCVSAVCGFNFKFGAYGAGNADSLVKIMTDAGHSAVVVEPVYAGGKIVSSSAIRAMIADGDMEGAAQLLGRPFSINFPVVYGKQLGRTIGIPTVNQNFPDGHIIPRTGIYVSTCEVDGVTYRAVANVGSRPTVTDEGGVNCETHIIGYDGVLYEKCIKVSFRRRLRDEMKFASIDELKKQITADIAATVEYFESM